MKTLTIVLISTLSIYLSAHPKQETQTFRVGAKITDPQLSMIGNVDNCDLESISENVMKKYWNEHSLKKLFTQHPFRNYYKP